MNFITENLFVIIGALSALAIAVFVFVVRRNKDPDVSFGLHDFVTLDSGGWWVVAAFGLIGSAVMILTSASIGVDYWTGLAVDADVAAGRIDLEGGGWLKFVTVGTVSFFVLALIFEFFSDLGVPLASGLAQRKKPFLPRLALAATAGCIAMSLITKWGYYDDKREFRENQVQKEIFVDSEWHKQKERAEADILLYAGAPSLATADATETAANRKIQALNEQIEEIQTTIDNTPETHSTNRRELTALKNSLTSQVLDAEGDIAKAAAMRDDRNKLTSAQQSLEEANREIEKLIGTTEEDGSTRVAAGDTLAARGLRVSLHQFLCWLFPLVWFEGRAGFIAEKRKEEANAKRRATNEEKKNTFDAEFEDVPVRTEPARVEVSEEFYEEKAERERREREELEALIKADADDEAEAFRDEIHGEADRSVQDGYDRDGRGKGEE